MQAKVLSRPELTEETEPYFAAFLALQRERPILPGMAVALPLAVPRAIIEAHARRIGIDDGDFREFVEIVAAIDDSYVEIEAKRILADLQADAAKGKGGR